MNEHLEAFLNLVREATGFRIIVMSEAGHTCVIGVDGVTPKTMSGEQLKVTATVTVTTIIPDESKH